MKEKVHYEIRTNSGRVVMEAVSQELAENIRKIRTEIDPRNELTIYKITRQEEVVA